jgi:cellulose synthase/poly-beta-1,6-N-acetylglucosamine synthase-like glycosyltransferase
MKGLMIALLIVYGVAALFLFVYSLVQSSLLFKYIFKKKNIQQFNRLEPDFIPKVTIQLPLYNELYVVERLIDKVCELDYPSDKLEIQVVDDSTDDSIAISKNKVAEWQAKGIDIVYIHRDNRQGFKAGALEEALELAKGDFIAIFDADFLPERNFLQRTIPHFKNDNIGLVQTRWGHLNRNYNLLTKLQAFALDAHFTIEQVGRNAKDGFINFNGTAGVWRKECILDAGNWSPDTLTEDLDLSYRAQLKDWQFIFLENVASPAELPPVMSALKTQQYRWTKGGAETAKKHVKNVLKSKKSIGNKWHGVMHLMNSAVFVSILTCALLSIPLLLVKANVPEFNYLFVAASVLMLSFVVLAAFYLTAFFKIRGRSFKNFLTFLLMFPMFMVMSMGLSLHNAIAVIEGYLGKKSSFVRTPKFNISTKADNWTKNIYIPKKLSWLSMMEGLFALYFIFGIFLAFYIDEYGLLSFHIMLSLGFSAVFFFSIFQSSKN